MTREEAIEKVCEAYDAVFGECHRDMNLTISTVRGQKGEPMDDLISKYEVIDIVKKECSLIMLNCKNHYDEEVKDTVYDDIAEVDAVLKCSKNICGKIKKLPSVTPERPTGRWIDAVIPNDNGGLPVQVCDQCNTFFPLAYTGGGHHFCPNCGTKMEVEHGED